LSGRRALLLALSGILAVAAPVAAVDLLYLAANEGGSSGGHVALRLDRVVFHFVHEQPGLVRLRRDSTADFERKYRLLENRSIRVTSLAADEDTQRRVRTAFTRRWSEQEQEFQRLSALRDERRLLEAVTDDRAGRQVEAPSFAGPGYFIDDDGAARTALDEEPALVRLRTRLARERGPALLPERLASARRALGALRTGTCTATEPAARCSYGFARRYEDRVVLLRTLEVLRAATPLRDDGLRPVGIALSLGERPAVESLARMLEDRALDLLDSRRPDRGFALVVTIARLSALQRSLDAGAWTVLDVLPPDGEVFAASRIARHRDATRAIARSGAVAFERARLALTAHPTADPTSAERRLAALERSASQWLAASQALTDGTSLRATGLAPIPARRMRHAHPFLPWSDAALASGLDPARHAERRQAHRIRDRYGYDLFRRNCATELVRTLDDALAVGGIGQAPLDFVPLALNARLRRLPSATETTELPSRRRSALRQLAADRSAFLVGLRESNTLTATTYDRNPDDSVFLFFTEGRPLARPLLGTVNLGVGLGATVAGIAAVPLDRGHLLWSGLRGAVFSLPELAFVNIRKGTYDRYAAAEPPDGLPEATSAR